MCSRSVPEIVSKRPCVYIIYFNPVHFKGTGRFEKKMCSRSSDIRSPPALDHIPLYSPLFGGVSREGLVTCSLPQTHLHRAPHMTRAIGLTCCSPTRSSSSASLHRNVQRFRGGLVFKPHRLLYHSSLGLRVMKKKKTCCSPTRSSSSAARARASPTSPKVNLHHAINFRA